jgi:quercetin dioxygenase-like cupin family protein
MKKTASTLACAAAVVLVFQSSSEAQTTGQAAATRPGDTKSNVIAVNTNELEAFPIDSGQLKFIASVDDTNGAYAIIERTQDPCYKTTWHRHEDFEESFYVLEGVWTVQIRDKVQEFPAGSFVQIPRGTPHGQGNFTRKPVRLLVLLTPGAFQRFYRERAELFKAKGGDRAELEKGLEALRRKYIQLIEYTWDIAKECRD